MYAALLSRCPNTIRTQETKYSRSWKSRAQNTLLCGTSQNTKPDGCSKTVYRNSGIPEYRQVTTNNSQIETAPQVNTSLSKRASTEHPHLASYGRGGVYLSRHAWRIQRDKHRTDDDNRPIAEIGQRRGNPPTPQAHTKAERAADATRS